MKFEFDQKSELYTLLFMSMTEIKTLTRGEHCMFPVLKSFLVKPFLTFTVLIFGQICCS